MDLSDLAFLMGGELPEDNGNDWRGIWVVAEPTPDGVSRVSRQMMSKARELGDRLGTRVDAVLLGADESAAAILGQLGADTVYFTGEVELGADAWVETLANLLTDKRPEIVLFAFSPLGREVAPRVAQRLKTGLVADVQGLDLDEAERLLVATRESFGGRSLAAITCPTARPQMATVHPNAFREVDPDHTRSFEVVPINASEATSRVRVISQESGAVSVPLERARVVVCGGKGLGGPEGGRLLHELAQALGGHVAGTRGAVEAGYVASENEVSARGTSIAPDLYIGVGVSGSMDHTDAMRQSRLIVAINQNADAPLVSLADIALVGNLHEILPALTRVLSAKTTPRQIATHA